ncbi:MAG: exo-alpha-sialidase [Trueperaceae bacterium]|nr:exo-alpha-sialidase [Trueperaceae bacterium]
MASESTSMKDGILREISPGRKEAFIPCSAPQSHAANLHVLPDGRLTCVWFAGTMEGMPDISIHQAIFDETSSSWVDSKQLYDNPGRSEQNPLLFNAPDGNVWLLYTSQDYGNQDTSVVRRRISTDGGISFGDPHTLIDKPGTFIRQAIVTLSSGELLLPVFNCHINPGERWTGSRDTSAVYRSADGGESWSMVEIPDSLGCVHMNIIELDNSLVALFRSRWADAIYLSRSYDDGKTWQGPKATSLPNNNSSIQAIKLNDGRLAMVYNHSNFKDASSRRESLYDDLDNGSPAKTVSNLERQAFWGTPRAPLSLIFSKDGGETWVDRKDLELGDGYCLTNNSVEGLNRELSYPSIFETRTGTLDIAFTYHRQMIKHLRLSQQLE